MESGQASRSPPGSRKEAVRSAGHRTTRCPGRSASGRPGKARVCAGLETRGGGVRGVPSGRRTAEATRKGPEEEAVGARRMLSPERLPSPGRRGALTRRRCAAPSHAAAPAPPHGLQPNAAPESGPRQVRPCASYTSAERVDDSGLDSSHARPCTPTRAPNRRPRPYVT